MWELPASHWSAHPAYFPGAVDPQIFHFTLPFPFAESRIWLQCMASAHKLGVSSFLQSVG